MKYKKFEKEIVLVLETGDNIHAAIHQVCQTENIGMGSIIGFGGIQSIRVGIWNNEEGRYDEMERSGDSMELLSLTGNITWKDGEPSAHIHVAAADHHFQVFGGHLIDGVVQNLMELYLYPGTDRIERIPHGSWFFMDI
jgi:predicted DNA-binding protein with PD1-like motif